MALENVIDDPKPELKDDLKPELKPEPKPELKPELQPELKPELKPELQSVVVEVDEDEELSEDDEIEDSSPVKKLLRTKSPARCKIGVFAYHDSRGGYSYQNHLGNRCFTDGTEHSG